MDLRSMMSSGAMAPATIVIAVLLLGFLAFKVLKGAIKLVVMLVLLGALVAAGFFMR